MTSEQKDKGIAAAITFAIMLIIVLLLFLGSITYDRELLAQSSIPEIGMEEEELFLEPEILKPIGEEDAVNHDSPAEAFKGEPEPAETDNPKLVVKGDNPKPAPPVQKVVTTTKESSVKATEPTISKEEEQKIKSTVANAFSGRNGNTEGKSSSAAGAGGEGSGVNGSSTGRNFLSCPSPNVSLNHKTVVKVDVKIDADGKVIEAKATGGGDADIRRKCEQAARSARWSAKKGASVASGTITFTIIPK